METQICTKLLRQQFTEDKNRLVFSIRLIASLLFIVRFAANKKFSVQFKPISELENLLDLIAKLAIRQLCQKAVNAFLFIATFSSGFEKFIGANWTFWKF